MPNVPDRKTVPAKCRLRVRSFRESLTYRAAIESLTHREMVSCRAYCVPNPSYLGGDISQCTTSDCSEASWTK